MTADLRDMLWNRAYYLWYDAAYNAELGTRMVDRLSGVCYLRHLPLPVVVTGSRLSDAPDQIRIGNRLHRHRLLGQTQEEFASVSGSPAVEAEDKLVQSCPPSPSYGSGSPCRSPARSPRPIRRGGHSTDKRNPPASATGTDTRRKLPRWRTAPQTRGVFAGTLPTVTNTTGGIRCHQCHTPLALSRYKPFWGEETTRLGQPSHPPYRRQPRGRGCQCLVRGDVRALQYG